MSGNRTKSNGAFNLIQDMVYGARKGLSVFSVISEDENGQVETWIVASRTAGQAANAIADYMRVARYVQRIRISYPQIVGIPSGRKSSRANPEMRSRRPRPIYSYLPKEICDPGSLIAEGLESRHPDTVIVSSPLYLRYMHFAPKSKPKGTGWVLRHIKAYPVYYKYKRFDVLTSGDLKKFIKAGIAARPGTNHVFFETLHRVEMKDGLPVYEVGMGS